MRNTFASIFGISQQCEWVLCYIMSYVWHMIRVWWSKHCEIPYLMEYFIVIWIVVYPKHLFTHTCYAFVYFHGHVSANISKGSAYPTSFVAQRSVDLNRTHKKWVRDPEIPKGNSKGLRKYLPYKRVVIEVGTTKINKEKWHVSSSPTPRRGPSSLFSKVGPLR